MLLTNLAILVLAGFAGFLTISKVPNTLHTPLMSGTNAIHGIVLLGGLIALGVAIGTAVGIPAARQVRMTAMAMPTAAMRLPRTAVRGPVSPISP